MGATVIITEYLAERGHMPNGVGSWLFVLCYDDGESKLIGLTGDFDECCKQAAELADDGLSEIILLP